MNQIIISPIFTHFFSGRVWMGLDYKEIETELQNYGFDTEVIPFADIAKDYKLLPQNGVLFYSFSYNEEYQKFIKDVVYDITQSRPDVSIIPNLDILYSFENKGYQELQKRRLGFGNLKGEFIGDFADLNTDEMEFPVVYKLLNGAVSSGVYLVKNQSELNNIVQNNTKRSFTETIQYLRRWMKKNKPSNMTPNHNMMDQNFKDFFAKRHSFVLQKFIPNLKCDFRVLIFGDKYFTMRRDVRKDDFRASGSGKQDWVEPSLQILNFAEQVAKKLKNPFLSLDIAEDASGCYLIEYQGLGFGSSALIKSEYFYTKSSADKWEKVTAKSHLEKTYAYAINHFINENH